MASTGRRPWKVCRSLEWTADQTDSSRLLSRRQRSWRASFTAHPAPHASNLGYAGRRCSGVGSGRAPRHEPQDLTEVRQVLPRFSEARSGGVNICAETVPSVLEML